MKKIKSSRMKMLVLNCGSSSVKYQLINGSNWKRICRGNISRIGSDDATVEHEKESGSNVKLTKQILNHEQAISHILESLLSKKSGALKDISEIFAVGHRVVHGGEYFSQPTLINPEVVEKIDECSQLAPLHNPPQLKGIEACQKLVPGVPQVAVFDTAFHQSMKQKSYLYALPYEYYDKYRIRRYGFHGTSHYYVANKAAKLENRPINDLKIITCHLGNGSSVAAVKHGQCVDTSMGFTPLEGLVMGTRSGDVDCSAVLFLMRQEDLSADQMDTILNKESGLKGLSGKTNDMRTIIENMDASNGRSQNAFDVFCYRVKKYIGSYIATLNGLDVLVFTAGIGENSPMVRAKICEEMDNLGIQIDHYINNNTFGSETLISKKNSPVKIWVIPTNEELVIAQQTLDVVYSIVNEQIK